MAEHWLLLGLMILTTFAIRASGPLALGERDLPVWGLAVVSLLAPALLAALVMTRTFTGGTELVIDERAGGIAAAGAVIALRGSPLAAVLVAAAVTAGLRAIG